MVTAVITVTTMAAMQHHDVMAMAIDQRHHPYHMSGQTEKVRASERQRLTEATAPNLANLLFVSDQTQRLCK